MRPIEDQSETHRRPTCLIRDQPTCLIGDPSETDMLDQAGHGSPMRHVDL